MNNEKRTSVSRRQSCCTATLRMEETNTALNIMDDYNRRQFIRTSLPGFLGLTLALPSIASLATRANACNGRLAKNATINWDAFLSEVDKVAKTQHLDHWKEEAYIQQVVQLSKRLNLKDPALLKGFENCKRGIGNGRVDFEDLEKNRDFAVCLLQFEKGEFIPPHDHPGMTGVIQCATGEISVQNYDMLGVRKGHETFLFKKSADTIMKKGEVSSLTSKARNIHTLKAHSLTQLVDVFAPPYDPQRAAKSSWFSIDSDPFEGKKDIFEATLR